MAALGCFGLILLFVWVFLMVFPYFFSFLLYAMGEELLPLIFHNL